MLRVRTQWNGEQGAPYLSTMFFAGTNEDDALAAVTAVNDYWEFLNPVISDALTYVVEGSVASIDEETGVLLGVLEVGSIGGVGADSGDVLPYAIQGLARWLTGTVINGHVLRGRNFIPGPTEASNTDGRPTSSYIAKVVAGGALLLADADTTLVVWSRRNERAIEVNGLNCWGQWAELRTRRD
jgi:hypothetical protein